MKVKINFPCDVSNFNVKVIKMHTSKRKQSAENILITTFPDIEFEYIGSGNESVVFTDNYYVYKVFDSIQINRNNLLKQLIGRFKDCKRLFNLEELIEVDGHSIIKYLFKKSKPYTGGRTKEVIEFLIESFERGIVHWDVKPLNFQIFDDGLRLIDYGYDIKPFNFKDFIFMVQRAFLMVKYPNKDDFKPLVRKALTNWELEELDGFVDFFNEVYSKILNSEKKRNKLLPIVLFNEEMLYDQIERMLSQFQCSRILLYSLEQRDPPYHSTSKIITQVDDVTTFHDTGLFDTAIVDLIGNKNDSSIIHGALTSINRILNEGDHCIIITENPFFDYELKEHPLMDLQNLIISTGFIITRIEDTKWQVDSYGGFYSQYIIITATVKKNLCKNVSLVIKACYQDGPVLEQLIRHIIYQVEIPNRFLEKIVVIDPKEDGFVRQFGHPDKELTIEILEKLSSERIIDDFFIAPNDSAFVEKINQRWFGIKTKMTHSVTDIPVFPQLYAYEKCKGKYILQVDSDAIVVRRDRNHSYLEDMKKALDNNKNAISVSFNIAHSINSVINEYTSPGNGNFVPEVRFCLIHRERFFKQRPYPNMLVKDRLKLTWYRSVKKAQSERGLISLRGGDPRTFYIHPPNDIKQDRELWYSILERAESGYVPEVQFENVDLTGKPDDWNIPKRKESFIFIICARNITPSKFLRCWQSVLRQTMDNWGAVIVDDASNNCLSEFISFITARYRDKVTFIRNHKRKGVLANINRAIRDFCINPNSVIIILDADDMLLSNDVILNLHRHYLKGADMTVGSVLRKDKGILPFVPYFEKPRNIRGGDVWMHLRTFRKYLFDSINQNDFKKAGKWIDKFTELTYMVPISEMASKPIHIKFPIYLWEPGHIRNNEHYVKNKETIDYIIEKDQYSQKNSAIIRTVKSPGEIIKELNHAEQIIFIRHAEKEKITDIGEKQLSHDVRLSENGQFDSKLWGSSIPTKFDLMLVSPTIRTIQTAKQIMDGNSSKCEIKEIRELRGISINNYDIWRKHKNEFGWIPLIEKWINNEIPESIVIPHNEFIYSMLKAIIEQIKTKKSKKTLVITHDHIIYILSALFLNNIPAKVSFLNGFVIDNTMLNEKFELFSGMRTGE